MVHYCIANNANDDAALNDKLKYTIQTLHIDCMNLYIYVILFSSHIDINITYLLSSVVIVTVNIYFDGIYESIYINLFC